MVFMRRIIENKTDLDAFFKLASSYKYPITATITRGRDRSHDQNRLAFMWYREASEQMQDEDAEAKRAFCKLNFAIPILVAESDEYRSAYNKFIRPLPYEAKLAMMRAPLDYPATRLLTTKQMTSYLDAIREHFEAQGVVLTIPQE